MIVEERRGVADLTTPFYPSEPSPARRERPKVGPRPLLRIWPPYGCLHRAITHTNNTLGEVRDLQDVGVQAEAVLIRP